MTVSTLRNPADPPQPQRPRARSLSEQRKRLAAYVRLANQNYDRAWRELQESFRIRKRCPYEDALRNRRYTDASTQLKLAEKCLQELNHCYVLRIAGFKPGDQIQVTVTMKGFPANLRRYVILDVIWHKGDSYSYEVQQLTKAGDPHGRHYPTWLSPSNRICIEYCSEPLGPEGERLSRYRRDSTRRRLEDAIEVGDLKAFLPEEPKPRYEAPARQYPFWLRGNR